MLHTIYLAGGCYWGVEKYMSNVPGVTETEVGFANGHVEAPAYVQVKKGDKVQFSVGVDRDESNNIPAGSFRFELMLTEGDGEEDKKAEPPKTAYAVTVTDEEGNPVEGVAVNLKGAFTYEPTENDPEDLEPTEVKVDLNLLKKWFQVLKALLVSKLLVLED